METKPTSMGRFIGVAIIAIVLAIAIVYLAKEMRAKYGPPLMPPAQAVDTSNHAASLMLASDEIPAIEADLRTIEQELRNLQAASE